MVVDAYSTAISTNSIFDNVSYTSSLDGDYNGFYNAPSFGGTYQFTNTTSPFETVGGGEFYLASCAFKGAGSADTNLQGFLSNKTTYPPNLITNDITNSVVLTPQVGRDNSPTPDLGYHYDPIDYLMGGGIYVYSTTLLSNGIAVALHGSTDDAGVYGAIVLQSGEFVSAGSPTAPNYVVWYNTVQESDAAGWAASDGALDMFGYTFGGTLLDCRFTRFCRLADTGAYIGVGGANTDGIANFRDSELFNGNFFWVPFPGASMSMTNCLLDRCSLQIDELSYQTNAVSFANCLFHNDQIALSGTTNFTYPIAFTNCFFDTTNISRGSAAFAADYNAYFTNNPHRFTNTHDVLLATNISPFISGPLGDFYQGITNLIDLGSGTADQFGLYHFTVQTNQITETNSITDIGYHYVAVDSNGNPLDTDGDGVPDYLEDANGNGTVDSGETDWQDANDLGLKVWITDPKDGANVP